MVDWPGYEDLDEFSARIDSKAKVGRGLGHIPGLIVKGRGGVDLFRADKLDKILPLMIEEQWKLFMPTEAKMLTELTAEIRKALEEYNVAFKDFRGAVKNDISSAKAAATAVEDAVRRMGMVYRATAAMLIEPEFVKGIENAERMATALRAISALQSHSITFAVLDKKVGT